MKQKRILFRADGNTVAGYGHVIRLLSLSSILRKKYICSFIIQNPDRFLKNQIIQSCDEIIEIPATKNLKKEVTFIAKNIVKPDDIVVLDGYGYDVNYQSEIKKHCFKLVCIDDIHDRHFVADAIINHGEGIKKENYSTELFSKLYLGINYLILRRSFLKKSSSRILTSELHKAFISMGGTDQQNYTQKALNVCLKNKTVRSIDIVVGSFYPFKKELQKIIDCNKEISIKIHYNLSEKKIYYLMKTSTVAICSASTVSYEYASGGGLLFVYQTVPNQKNIYAFLIRSKVAFPIQSFNKTLASFKNKKIAEKYFENRNNYFSGGSAKNLVSIFESLEKERGISIRSANESDVLTYFKWANDPEVRKNSVNTVPIQLEDHKKWFFARLKNKNSRLYIIEKNKIPIGQVRFDKENNISEIDYSIGKNFRGKGYGEIILKDAIKEYFHQFPKDKIIAKAKVSNIASNRVFEKLGFKKTPPSVINGTKYNCYTISAC
jgi:UDP-2,4-diacetamido-2,4,6-trideoxy-beta-L-altropyranose hydrolase